MPKTNLTSTYKSLLTKVKNTFILGQQRIEAQKVKTYWETGRLIHADILKHADRAAYGTELVNRLAQDLNIHPRLLRRCIQFAKAYPRPPIVSARSQLTWTHYRELVTIPDPKEREQIEERMTRSKWSTDELAVRIKGRRSHSLSTAEEGKVPAKQEILTPKRGMLYTYRVIKRPALGGLVTDQPLLLDLGFGVYKRISTRIQKRFAADQIVESDYDTAQESYSLRTSERTAKDLFTYQAVIEKVIDADTLKVRIDLGFDLEHRETLRLREIDAPEVGTKAGDAAKAFVQSLLKEASRIVFHSTRSDKYDRYLADVFIPGDVNTNGGVEVFLNHLLLEEGYARRI